MWFTIGLLFLACQVEEEKKQVQTGSINADNDGDGFVDSEDCDDQNANVYPNAEELCDGVDNDCDNDIDEGVEVIFFADTDEDGFGDSEVSMAACTPPDGYVSLKGDCDDNDAEVSPAQREFCDEKDNDCDGDIDEAGSAGELTWYIDADGDGFGDDATQETGCWMPSDAVYVGADCDDSNALANPAMAEVCDGTDNDCDGAVDEEGAFGEQQFYADGDADGFGDANNSVTACELPSGYVVNDDDCSDTDAAVFPGAPEYCNQQDDDCNGLIDEASAVDSMTWFLDADSDGYGNADFSFQQCEAPSGYVANSDDCNDLTSAVAPNAAEICDGIDNDCDALVDQADTDLDSATMVTYYLDADGDGFGQATPSGTACDAPVGSSLVNGDCDDGNIAISPNATEVCDNVDNDCDGLVDGNDPSFDSSTLITHYVDADGDGYGNSAQVGTSCELPSGTVELAGDCDDDDVMIHPDATEVCDGIDNDCDNDIDDADSSIDLSTADTFYADADTDGYGDASDTLQACTMPSGYVSDATDCNDGDVDVSPGAVELCDGSDNDCDGTADNNEAIGSSDVCVAIDCQDILDQNPNAPDGNYWLETSSGSVEHLCEMDADGGGWTLVMSVHTNSVPGYASSWWTNPQANGSLNTLSDYRSSLFGELSFSEVLFTVQPDSDPNDRIEIAIDFAASIPNMSDAFANSYVSVGQNQLAGSISVQGGPFNWGFNQTCSTYGPGTVRFGSGQGNCGIFYGLGCQGAPYCGVHDFYPTIMSSNTTSYYPSGAGYSTFTSTHQFWVR